MEEYKAANSIKNDNEDENAPIKYGSEQEELPIPILSEGSIINDSEVQPKTEDMFSPNYNTTCDTSSSFRERGTKRPRRQTDESVEMDIDNLEGSQ